MQTPAALNTAFAAGDALLAVAESLKIAGARTVLDIGCGHGRLAAFLAARNFVVSGVDPNPAAVDAARAALPDANFAVGNAESLGFAEDTFDAAVFLNSLHHVPVAVMRKALAEARRVTGAKGTILIVEPLAEGPGHEAMKPLEDETEVLDAAGRAIADAVREGDFALRGNVVFDRRDRYVDADAYIDRLQAVDPLREAAIADARDEIRARFDAVTESIDEGRVLVQPLRIYWLAALK
ncbi:class I SAM-dependent methyltransferase [Aurantimonas sp. VKM B-3413]|uniref:class I SAM-dependent methyltransferase n=1 Tax=Aurantimonas sp. VKM B-3413 TaxID=2779401 RepID=UPI001E390439|nr:class I SAM-dependent methyltransferase [Aurantimonas sp. VKM B-3413]MCB8839310.1 class I SAM-dependent methyltransferase [Aurantimonas sp. VKM B-3413]